MEWRTSQLMVRRGRGWERRGKATLNLLRMIHAWRL
jgi:hypothetical protein